MSAYWGHHITFPGIYIDTVTVQSVVWISVFVIELCVNTSSTEHYNLKNSAVMFA